MAASLLLEERVGPADADDELRALLDTESDAEVADALGGSSSSSSAAGAGAGGPSAPGGSEDDGAGSEEDDELSFDLVAPAAAAGLRPENPHYKAVHVHARKGALTPAAACRRELVAFPPVSRVTRAEGGEGDRTQRPARYTAVIASALPPGPPITPASYRRTPKPHS